MYKAEHSPCYICNSIGADKDYAPCDICLRPVRYALGITDIRLVKELYEQDERRLRELSATIINETYLHNKAMSIDVKLDLLAFKHGFPNHKIWLRHLYLGKNLSPYSIADITKTSATAIRARLIKQKIQLRTQKESAGHKWTNGQKKKVSKSCKGRTPWNKGKIKKYKL